MPTAPSDSAAAFDLDPAGRVVVEEQRVFTEPGTHFLAVRVAAQAGGDAGRSARASAGTSRVARGDGHGMTDARWRSCTTRASLPTRSARSSSRPPDRGRRGAGLTAE